jgi:hypothetical protein
MEAGPSRTALVRRARRINRELARLYPDAHIELNFTSPLEQAGQDRTVFVTGVGKGAPAGSTMASRAVTSGLVHVAHDASLAAPDCSRRPWQGR